MTTHYIAAFAIRYTSRDTCIVYSADTAYDERVIALARNADLFLCEATLGAHGSESGSVKGHICAAEAGRFAQMAGVAQLMLTHYGAECDLAELEAAARSAFTGEVFIADDHQSIVIGEKLPV